MGELREIWSMSLGTLPGGGELSVAKIVYILLLLLLGYGLSRLVPWLLSRRLTGGHLKPDAILIIRRLAFFTILTVVVLTALSLLEIPLTAFAFITGAVAIGVGFGAQNIINNFISGWILMTERPIRIDDFVEIDGTNGIVEHIGTRSTRIRRVDGVHLLVPNSTLLEKTVINWTLIDHSVRTKVIVGVAYGSPVRQVSELILQAVTEQPGVKAEPKPIVFFEDFGDSALVFEAYFWCDVTSERELRVTRSEIRYRITELFEESDIVIAFPQRDVHLDAARPIDVRMVSPD